MAESNTKLNPLVAIAAASIILFSIVGTAVVTGVIPSSRSEPEQVSQAAPAPAPKQPSVKAKTPARHATEPTRVASASPRTAPPRAVCAECGTVSSVNLIEEKGQGSGLGAVAGGIVGGVLGNQIGGGNGRTLATVAGVAGGAYAGNQVEKQIKATKHYEVAVQMEDGTVRHFRYESEPSFQPGDKVKVANGRLTS